MREKNKSFFAVPVFRLKMEIFLIINLGAGIYDFHSLVVYNLALAFLERERERESENINEPGMDLGVIYF